MTARRGWLSTDLYTIEFAKAILRTFYRYGHFIPASNNEHIALLNLSHDIHPLTRFDYFQKSAMQYRSIFRYKTFYSDVVHINATSRQNHFSNRQNVILFIPGNPGLLDYYDAFLQHLYDLQKGRTSIYAISQLSHTLHSPRGGSTSRPTLQDQVAAKVEFLKTLPKNCRVTLIGHSVGSWIALQMQKQISVQVDIIMLFPTVTYIANTPNGNRLKYLFYRPSIFLLTWLVYCIQILSRFIPTQVLLLLVQLLTGQRDSARDTTVSLATSSFLVNQCLSMAREEMVTIKELDKDPFFQSNSRIHAILAQKHVDNWTTEEQVEQVTKAIGRPGRVHRVSENLPHAFCVKQEHSEYVAGVCNSWLHEINASATS